MKEVITLKVQFLRRKTGILKKMSVVLQKSNLHIIKGVSLLKILHFWLNLAFSAELSLRHQSTNNNRKKNHQVSKRTWHLKLNRTKVFMARVTFQQICYSSVHQRSNLNCWNSHLSAMFFFHCLRSSTCLSWLILAIKLNFTSCFLFWLSLACLA